MNVPVFQKAAIVMDSWKEPFYLEMFKRHHTALEYQGELPYDCKVYMARTMDLSFLKDLIQKCNVYAEKYKGLAPSPWRFIEDMPTDNRRIIVTGYNWNDPAKGWFTLGAIAGPTGPITEEAYPTTIEYALAYMEIPSPESLLPFALSRTNKAKE